MTEQISVLLVDDEKPARDKLRYFLAKEPDINIIGEASDGESALQAIGQLKPDVVFIDIQMPYPDGIEVVIRLDGWQPLIVFTTAYEEYAIKAFEVGSVDYLLKPFDSRRFAITLDRVRKILATRKDSADHGNLLETMQQIKASREKAKNSLTVKHGQKYVVVPYSDVIFFEAEGNYIKIVTQSSTFIVRKTISEMASETTEEAFLRIHRSYIINVHQVKEIHPHFNGEYVAVMKTGQKLPCSRSYREALKQHFNW